ncbi:MAG TPA: HEPN domain-containing protein [Segetibacter sp.]
MGNLDEIIQFRFQRSNEALEEALLLFKSGHYNSTVNRLYYSAFYAVSALLLKDKIYSKSHSGLKSLFNEHLVKKERLGKEEAGIYNELFAYRQNADYKDLMIFSQEDVEPLIERTENFIDEIKKLI